MCVCERERERLSECVRVCVCVRACLYPDEVRSGVRRQELLHVFVCGRSVKLRPVCELESRHPNPSLVT